jgi:hypothetical protein
MTLTAELGYSTPSSNQPIAGAWTHLYLQAQYCLTGNIWSYVLFRDPNYTLANIVQLKRSETIHGPGPGWMFMVRRVHDGWEPLRNITSATRKSMQMVS